jgi:two-component system, chemotaxis family, CheB/CheR fusion protein
MAETFNLLPQDVGRRIEGFTHSIEHPQLLDEIRDVLRSGERRQRQVRDRKGGWFLLRILPYRTHVGVDGVVLTLIDVGALRHAEEENRTKDRYLASILRNSPNFVFIKDLKKRYVLADDAYRRVLGCDPVGKTAHDVYPREIADRISAQDDEVLTLGASIESEIDILLSDGMHTYLSVRFPLLDEQQQTIGVSGIKIDVTALKRAEQEARDAVEQRDQFLAMLSHELRNPLAAILNAAHAMESQELPTSAAEWFHVIERRARHMARLLDDLLDVSRLTRNKIELERKPFELANTISGVLEEALPRFAEHDVNLTVMRPESLLPVDGDPDRLQQIQVNLLLNAAKYTPAGGQVWYSMSREENHAVIRVRDTGRGIAPTALAKIFNLFFQSDHALDRSAGGIGVGLTLVRALVELHGGSVEASSPGIGKGSEFVVRLPLCDRIMLPATLSDTVGQPARSSQLALDLSPCRIVLVEDDTDIRTTMQALLEMSGHHVRSADTAPAALALLRDGLPDVMLIDIGLPEMNGYDLARVIRQTWGPQQVRLVALTGYGQARDRQSALEAGFDEHLTKPLRPSDLYRALKNASDQLSRTPIEP